MSASDDDVVSGFADRTTSGRRTLDWILAGLLVLLGLVIGAIGGLLIRVADRNTMAELVADETIESDIITQAELVDILFAGSWWGGLGTIAAGVVMIGIGLVFGFNRRRVDRAGAETEPPTLWANALLGAFVTAITSFVPFSAILGGGVAGHLETADSWKGALAGALAGFLLAIPVIIIGGAIVIGFTVEGLATTALLAIIALTFGSGFSIGLSAIGGAAGGYLRNRS